MKFGKLLAQRMVPEWSDRYLRYKMLKGQLKRISAACENHLPAYENHAAAAAVAPQTDFADEEMPLTVEHMEEEDRELYDLLEEDLDTVERFYLDQLVGAHKRFYQLLQHCLSMELLEEYTPHEYPLLSDVPVPESAGDINPTVLGDATEEDTSVTVAEEEDQDDIDRSSTKRRTEERKASSTTSSSTEGQQRASTVVRTPPEKTKEHQRELSRLRKERVLYGVKLLRRLRLKKMATRTRTTYAFEGIDQAEDGSKGTEIAVEDTEDEIRVQMSDDAHDEPSTPQAQQQQRWFLPARVPTIRHHRKSLIEAFKEYYRGLCLLESFCKLNLSGFDKVMKKHDKLTGNTTRLLYIMRVQRQHRFADMRHLLIIKAETERIFGECFTESSRQRAMKKLRIHFWRKKNLGWSTFRLGLSAGLSTVLLLIILIMFIYMGRKDSSGLDGKRADDVFIMFRGMWLLVILNWCWGIDMYMWTRYRVSYALIFLFDMRSHIGWQQVMESAAVFTVSWLLFVVCYLLSAISPVPLHWMADFPYQVFPGCLGLLMIVVMVIQQSTCKYWLFLRVHKIIVSPVTGVDNFVDIYLASQLTSLVIFLQDVEFSICFFLSDAWTGGDVCLRSRPYIMPLIAAIPFALRFLQCLRKFLGSRERWHIVNGGKYLSSLAVMICSSFLCLFNHLALFVLWILAVLVSVGYNFYFDVRYDWGLLDMKAKNRFLRDKLIFPRWWYYVAISFNLLGRCSWALTVSAPFFSTTNMILSTVIATLEVLRRGVGNIFCLEYEQLSYAQRRRATRDVKLPLSVGTNEPLELLFRYKTDDL